MLLKLRKQRVLRISFSGKRDQNTPSERKSNSSVAEKIGKLSNEVKLKWISKNFICWLFNSIKSNVLNADKLD